MRDVQRWGHRGLLISLTGMALALAAAVAGDAVAGDAVGVPVAAGAVPGRLADPLAEGVPDERCLAASRPSAVRRPPDTMPPDTMPPGGGELSAWAVHPGDGRLYAVSDLGSLIRWDPESRRFDSGFPDAVVPQGAYESVVFDAAGDAYVETPEPRRVYQIDLRGSTASAPVPLETIEWGRALGDVSIGTCMPVADFGDAPAAYGTTEDGDGPAHRTGPRLRLGDHGTLEPDAATAVGGEQAGPGEEQGGPTGDKPGSQGDEAGATEGETGALDGTGDAGDDALGPLPPIEPYMSRYTLRVPYRNRLGGPVTLAGWLDTDLSRTFDRDERQVVVRGGGDGTAELRWRLPEMRSTGTGYLRLRLYDGEVADPRPTGAAGGPGEVEDHPIQVRGAPVADLGVEALPAEVAAGARGVLALLVHNEGPYDSEVDARIEVTPPPQVTFGGLPSNCREHRKGAVVCLLPAERLPAGGVPVAQQLPFQVSSDASPKTALRGGSVSVTGVRDPEVANNSARLAIGTSEAVSDLSARLVKSSQSAVPGRAAEIAVEVANAGPSDTRQEAELVLRVPAEGATASRLPQGCREDAGQAGREHGREDRREQENDRKAGQAGRGSPAPGGEVVRCAVPAGLRAGDSRSFQIPLTLASGLSEGARLRGGSASVRLGGDPDSADNKASYELRAEEPVSRLSVSAVPHSGSDSGRVAPGETFDYTVRVRNRGPSDASDVRLSQALPAALTVAGPLDLDGCTETGSRLRCTEGTLPAGKSVEYDVTARLTPVYSGNGSDLADTVTVTAATRDPDPGDNAGRHRLPAGVAPPKMDVTVRVRTSGGAITPGTSDLLTVTAKNRGPSQTDGKGRHVISLPPGMVAPAKLPDGCSAAGNGERIRCRIPRGIWPGGASTWTIPVETGPVVPPNGVFTGGRVRIFGTRDPVARNDRTTFTIRAGQSLADLVVTKRAAKPRQIGPGGVFTYEFTVTNSGPSNARDVVVRDRLPEELSYIRVDDDCRAKGRTLECRRIPLLRRGEFESRRATVKLDPGYRGNGQGVAAPASASAGTRDPDMSNNRSALDESGLPGGVVVHPPADLSIRFGVPSDRAGLPSDKAAGVPSDQEAGTGRSDRPDRPGRPGTSAAKARMLPGRTTEIAVTVRNSGPFEAVQQSVTGVLPAPVTFVSSPDGCTPTEHGFTCPPVDSLGGGERLTRRVTLRLDPLYGGDGSDLAVLAKAVSYSLDPDPADNTITWYPMRSTA